MQNVLRMIDANINRASEGLRVIEDVARFSFNNKNICSNLKKLRHDVRKSITGYLSSCLDARNSENDVGLAVSRELEIDKKSCVGDLVAANFKRVQEALRTVEEGLKINGGYKLSKLYERLRFQCYSLEKSYYTLDVTFAKRKKLDTDIYCLTAEQYSKGRNNIEVVKEMLNAGIKLIQYREKDKKMFDKYKECLEIRELTKKAGAVFIINDNVDLAIAVEADGVHVGQDDLPVQTVRELVGQDKIIGVSTHSPDQAHRAVSDGADYIGVGPIYKTFTKKDVCDPVGLEYLDYVIRNIDIPFTAIGGIKEHNIVEVKSRGAKCFAMVTEIVGADNIGEKIKNIRKKLMEEK